MAHVFLFIFIIKKMLTGVSGESSRDSGSGMEFVLLAGHLCWRDCRTLTEFPVGCGKKTRFISETPNSVPNNSCIRALFIPKIPTNNGFHPHFFLAAPLNSMNFCFYYLYVEGTSIHS